MTAKIIGRFTLFLTFARFLHMEYQYHTLHNGIRIIHKMVGNDVAHLGVVVNTGSRDEELRQNGLAHFIEHMIFKGTTHRKAYHIIGRIENVGGDINAYTSKEETFIHTSFLNTYYPRSVELLADILFNSTFPEKEIEKEKDVILDEINSYKDNPQELIYDEFEEMLFDGHPFGRNILGIPKTVKKFSRQDINEFISENYHTDQMIICSVGKIDFPKLIKMAEKWFGNVTPNLRKKSRIPINDYRPKQKFAKKKIFQTHSLLGQVVMGQMDPKKTAMILLNNYLGGPGMNSRLNLAIREKHGISYNIESQYFPYSDTGVFAIYFGTDNGNFEKTYKLILSELKLLCTKKLGTVQLHRAKQQLTGQIAIAHESNLNDMISVGKSALVFEKIDSIEEVYRKINKVTAEEVLEVANIACLSELMSLLVYQPSK